MAFIPVPQTAQVTMVYTGPNANRMVNVYHFRRLTGDWDPTTLTELSEAMLEWELENARAQRSNQITCVSCEARDISTADSWVVELNPIPAIVGTDATPVLPANVTFALKFLTGRAGRSYRGRTYWIGLAEGRVNGDFLANAAQAQARADHLTVLVEELAPSLGAEMVVVSKYANGAPRTTGVATPVMTVAYTDLRVDTQRRRLSGEGG